MDRLRAIALRFVDRIETEPVIVLDAVKAVLVLLSAYGFAVAEAQMAAITALAWALLTIVQRQSVMPVAKLPPEGR